MSFLAIPSHWDHEADIIVIGAGTAGLPAAVIAAEAGFKVTVLESTRVIGGSFRMVAGSFAIAGSDEQKDRGIEDSLDVFYEDLIRICGSVPDLARAYVDNQIHAYHMLKEEGVEFPTVNALPGHSRRRGLSVGGRGAQIAKVIERRAKEKGVEILFMHRATRLFQNHHSGKVLGVRVNAKNETKNVKARRAVIVTSGGFGRNVDMISEYAPAMVHAVPKMPNSHVGDGLRMALDVGAATKDIGGAVAPSWPVCVETHSSALWAIWYGGILVNADGKRFHDESCAESSYVHMTEDGMRQRGGVYWVIFNEKIMAAIGWQEGVSERVKAHVEDIRKCRMCEADTIEELARKAGINAEGLRNTIEKYNGDVDNVGYDTVFGRKYQFGSVRPLVKIDAPKFYAIKCVTSTTSLKGGVKINAACQVLNNYDDVIPGLYAAGEVAGGLHTKAYLLGVMSSASFTFGMIAGRNACKEPAW